MMKRLAALAAVVMWAFPGAASATIVPNRGMFGVGIGATMKQVRGKLGSPNHVDSSGAIWSYGRRHVTVWFGPHLRVMLLSTTNPSQRTVRGIGVGSNEQDVKQLVPGVQCSAPDKSDGTDCIVVSRTKPRDTDFYIGTNGLVDNVAIGVY